MKKFPKKYNHKNINNTQINLDNINKKDIGVDDYSTLFPSDQKIHPGCIFSLFFQDLVSEIDNLKWNKNNRDIWFWMSSDFYSKLNNSNLDRLQLDSQVLKQSKQNKKFFDKLWLWCNITQESHIMIEEFNRYIRNVFVDLYQDQKISSQKEIASRSKKLQTNLFKNNISTKEQEVVEYTIKYFVDSKWHALTIPTTSLETIFADIAVAVNPQDKRYKKLIWKDVIIPIINKVIPIIWDETIDSFKWSWVFRITPGHDKFWLDLAQKHNLPTDVFAVDINWNFTKHAGEFAGKSVKDFFENIVKYIDDIGNLESKRTIKENKKIDLHTGELLDDIMLSQRSVKYSYALDYLSQKIWWEDFSIIPMGSKTDMLELLNQKQSINISNKSTKGILIPIIKASKWDVFSINDAIIVDRYKASNTKKNLTLTLIISNLILDNYLPTSFTIEELINILFAADLRGEKTKLEKYIKIYKVESEKLKIKEYKKWLKNIEKLLWKIEKDNETIQIIIDLLKDSYAIKFNEDQITLDFSTIFWKRDVLTLQREDWFSKSFIDGVRYLYKNSLSYSNKSYENVKTIWGAVFACEDQKDFVLNTSLLALEYTKNIMFSSVIFHPSLVDIKWNKIVNSNSRFLIKDLWENMVAYGADATRLALLLADKEVSDNIHKIKFDTYKTQEYSQLLNKIRNASRYVYSKYIAENNKKIKIKTLIDSVESNTTDYDLWMIHSIKTILDDYDYRLSENKTLELWSKILSFCKNTLCDKYLESTKIHYDKNTSNVTILSFILVLRLIKPYIPSFVSEIESLFDIDRWNYNIFDFKEFTLKEKNYKINLLMDIVDKLQNLKIEIGAKKHETVDIFVQANPEFLEFFIDNKELLNSLVNISNIELIRLHEETPQWYTIDNVININLWIRAVEQEEIKKDVLVEMEEERTDKLEHLQHLKSLVASVSQSGNEDILTQKRKEISTLQQEVEDLDFEITKLKAR